MRSLRWFTLSSLSAGMLLGGGCLNTLSTRFVESVQRVNPLPAAEQGRTRGGYQQRNSPGRNARQLSIAWARSTVFDSLRRPLNTASTGLIVTQERLRELFRGNRIDLTRLPDAAVVPPPGSPGFEAWLDSIGVPAAVPGRLEFVADGAFFERLEADLLAARREIDVQLFIWDNDATAQHFADLLRQRAFELQQGHCGVPVRVLVDNLATAGEAGAISARAPLVARRPPENIVSYLKRDGAPLAVRRSPNPSFMADHSKMWIIDGRHAWFGGMNMGWEYRHDWHDLMVRADGPVVAELAGRFQRNWTALGAVGRLGARDTPRLADFRPSSADVSLRVVETDSARLNTNTEQALLGAMRGARRRIWLQNSYCSSDRVLAEAVAAARRGVDVRLLLPDEVNHRMMDGGNWLAAAELIGAGGKAWAFPGMTHVKAYVCDDWAYVGSANLDFLSLRINRELGVITGDPPTVRRLVAATFDRDFARSTPVSLEQAREKAGGMLGEWGESVADQF